jgi:hypothetical protein
MRVSRLVAIRFRIVEPSDFRRLLPDCCPGFTATGYASATPSFVGATGMKPNTTIACIASAGTRLPNRTARALAGRLLE